MMANNLKSKVIFSSILLLLVYFLGTAVNEYAYLSEKDQQHQQLSLISAVKTSEEILQRDLNALNSIAVDYAYWSDTYHYMNDNNAEYLKENFEKNSLFSDIKAIFIWNDSDKKQLVDMDIETKGFYLSLLNELPHEIKSESGFVFYHGLLHQFSIVDVRKTRGSKNSPGYLMLISQIDRGTVSRILNKIGLKGEVRPNVENKTQWISKSLSRNINFESAQVAKISINDSFWFDIKFSMVHSEGIYVFMSLMMKNFIFMFILIFIHLYMVNLKIFESLDQLIDWVKSIDLSNQSSFKTDSSGDTEILEMQNKIGHILQYQVEKESHHTGILNSITDYIVIIDRQGVIQYVNLSGAEWLGESQEELVGMTLDYWLSIEHNELSVFPWLKRCFKTGQNQNAIFKAIKYRGDSMSSIKLQAAMAPIVSANTNSIEQVMLIAREAIEIEEASIEAVRTLSEPQPIANAL